MPSRTLLLEAGTDGGKKKPIQVRGIDQYWRMHHNWARLQGTKLVRTLVELLFNDPEVTKIQNGPVAEQLASDPMLRGGV